MDSLAFHDEPLRTSLGGNGANSALALARLGAEVNLVGGLGEDHLGDWMAEQLVDAGGVEYRTATPKNRTVNLRSMGLLPLSTNAP